MLGELNKYAPPREGDSPIRQILLDVAERGRSLGVILIGAQQTASEVERRILATCASLLGPKVPCATRAGGCAESRLICVLNPGHRPCQVRSPWPEQCI